MKPPADGALIAFVVAGLFGCAGPPRPVAPPSTSAPASAGARAEGPAAPASAPSKPIRCDGINACRGQSRCHTASNECAGENSCKGKGWLLVSAEECEARGGKSSR
jgi:hypothetical protein